MKLKYITWIPAVVMMVLIFWFSSKQADDSNNSSLKIANKVLSIYETITHHKYYEEEKVTILNEINHIVRKTAHFCEYALLSFLFAFHIWVISIRNKRLFLIPILLSFLYASFDEFHQTFVSGRAGMFRDVLLDSAGAATGSLFFTLLIILFINKAHKKH